jgi:hypothetical protein
MRGFCEGATGLPQPSYVWALSFTRGNGKPLAAGQFIAPIRLFRKTSRRATPDRGDSDGIATAGPLKAVLA